MSFFEIYYNQLVDNGIIDPRLALGLLGAVLLLLIVQLYYYLGVYGRLPRYRNNRGIDPQTVPPPVSVIVVARENSYYFIEHTLPLLLGQQYHQYEVVVVDCSYDEEIGLLLNEAAAIYPHLRLTRINAQPNYEHSIKLAITVGIKAAAYEHMVFTTVDSYPTSERWLSLMAKGFICGDVVIGYCGIEPKKGMANRWMRCSRLMTSVRYLSAATRGKTFRGTEHNIGYTKSLYFDSRGFNHLNMNIGVDDLFIQKIVRTDNVSVVMNPNATVRQIQYGGLGWWYGVSKYFGHAFRYYPAKARRAVRNELSSRFLFFATTAAAAALLPVRWIAVPLLPALLRLLIVELKMHRIGRRLGEKKFGGTYILYDFWAPLGGFLMTLSRRIRPNKAIWR